MKFTLEDWQEFLDAYKELLMKTEDIFAESKENYRVKKLAVFYGLRDKKTFRKYLKTKLGSKYLGIARYVLETVLDHEFYGYEENCEVANFLLDKYFKNSNIEKIKDEEFLEGYYKFFSDFAGVILRQKELNDIEVDLDKLKIE